MTPGDTARVLAACALFDYRRTTPEDVAGWHLVIGDLDLDDCLEAVRRHYSDSTERLMPAHIRRQVRAIRAERRPPSDALALPSGFEGDMGRQVRLERGLAGCRDVVAALQRHYQQRRAITANPEPTAEETR